MVFPVFSDDLLLDVLHLIEDDSCRALDDAPIDDLQDATSLHFQVKEILTLLLEGVEEVLVDGDHKGVIG